MNTLLEVQNLSMHFPIHGGLFKKQIGNVYAVNNVSIDVVAGETLGIVGESGCGKTTLGRAIVRLYEPTGGDVIFQGENLNFVSKEKMMSLRKNIQMIFQDPYASLNPRMHVLDILEEPMRIHKMGTKETRRHRVLEIMRLVGLRADDIFKFPHEFSGGQRQRIGIARALTLDPKLIIADEPVSALDVSIQSQVLNLMIDLQKKLSLTYIFVSHDLTVIKYISDRVGVMYLGHLVELATTKDLYATPRHPYTQALLSSVPVANPLKRGVHQILEGEVPSPSNPPGGCPFHTRCKYVTDVCKQEMPVLTEFESGHKVACHNAKKISTSEELV